MQLGAPGELQSADAVPGEAEIEAGPPEIYVYADVLAARNGFAPIGTAAPEGPRRDPDLVFPGDRLRLPDGRVARVEPGQHILEIARRHYRRDFARLLILERQLQAGDLDPAERRERLGFVERLAVTPAMRELARRIRADVL